VYHKKKEKHTSNRTTGKDEKQYGGLFFLDMLFC